MSQHLSEPVRREIFSALVDAQDQEMPVAESRREIARRFGVTDEKLREIEREGLENDRPPLED